jgi:hypothetical protein
VRCDLVGIAGRDIEAPAFGALFMVLVRPGIHISAIGPGVVVHMVMLVEMIRVVAFGVAGHRVRPVASIGLAQLRVGLMGPVLQAPSASRPAKSARRSISRRIEGTPEHRESRIETEFSATQLGRSRTRLDRRLSFHMWMACPGAYSQVGLMAKISLRRRHGAEIATLPAWLLPSTVPIRFGWTCRLRAAAAKTSFSDRHA